MYLRFDARDFSRAIAFNSYQFGLDWLTWNVEGGPEAGEARVAGDMQNLMLLPQMLRCGVNVSDENGWPAWWGYVHEVEVHLDGLVYLATLDDMANRVAVRYRAFDPAGGEGGGWESQTIWFDSVESVRSINQYGYKELIDDIGEGNAEDAKLRAVALLAVRYTPQTRVTPGDRLSAPYGIVRMRGWFETLGWRYWSEARGYVGNGQQTGINFIWGQSSSFQREMQSWYVAGSSPWEVYGVRMPLWKVGAPADNVIVELCDDSSGTPGTVRASVTIAASTLKRDAGTWVEAIFTTPYTVTNGIYYVIQLRRSGSVDAANYFTIRADADALIDGTMKSYTGSGWTTHTGDFVIDIFGQEESTTQMANVANGDPGQFLNGAYILNASGVKISLYQIGKKTGLEMVKDLLAAGDSNGGPMEARVTHDRYLAIRQRPVSTTPELVIVAGGEVRYRTGQRLSGSDSPVGRWARIEPLQSVGGDLGAPGLVYITRAEWRNGSVRVWWD